MIFTLQSRYKLEKWQRVARDRWLNSHAPNYGPRHGIIALFTGAGKIVVSLACLAELSQENPNRRFAIVAPKGALARQWQRVIPQITTLPASKLAWLEMVRRIHLKTTKFSFLLLILLEV